jgi:hypothetical protein
MKTVAKLLAAIAAALSLTLAHAADPGVSKSEAKDMKNQSEAQYKASQKEAEAKEDLDKADCKNELSGAAQRSCEKSAKMAAKKNKADAKTQHEAEEQAIKDSKK